MASAAGPSIKMTRDIGFQINWQSLAKTFADVLSQGFVTAFGITDGGSSIVGSLIGAFTAVKVEDNPEEKAWRLFVLSFAWSIDQLRADGVHRSEDLISAAKDAVQAAKLAVDSNEAIVPLTFFHKPTTLPLYQNLRDAFVARKALFRSNNAESDSNLSARFDSAFSMSIFEIWLRRSDDFQSISGLLSNPGIHANSLESQWAAYRAKLISDFEVQAMFGQEGPKISLAQAYIPLRCFWRTEVQNDERGGGYEKDELAMLDAYLEEWVADAGDTDVRLIGGGPGSGKSTTMKRLARYCADQPSIRPLLVPLQHIGLDGSLRDAINAYFTGRTRGSFLTGPLARENIEDGPRLLLIFDGLDEIARPGEGADEVANLFVTKLDQLVSALDGDSDKKVKVIVTGRLPSFQAAKRFKGATGKCAIEVLGYAPIENAREPSDSELSGLDQRPLWWERYAPLVGLPTQVPEALRDPRLRDLTNEPLLCYLLVLSGFAVDDWEAAADNRNRIYQRLVDEVWRRGWGDAKRDNDRQGPGRHLAKASFNDLMETFALAAWLGGDTRVATEEAFTGALRITHAENAWREFNGDGGEDVANLAMNFYLKSPDSNHRGFEFTHKSFGDYLAARAIVALAKEVSSLVPRHTDAALQTWLKGTAGGKLTQEILTFIRDEVRLWMQDDTGSSALSQLADACQVLVRTVLDEGLPAQSTSTLWNVAARNERDSEVVIWAVMNACIRGLNLYTGEDVLAEVGFADAEDAMKAFLLRVSHTDESQPPILKCLSHLNAKGSNLFAMNLVGADMAYSDLSGGNLSGTHLMDARLSYCNLRDARMGRANLDRSDFTGADVDGLNLVDARVAGADFLNETAGIVTVSARTLLDVPVDKEIDESRLKFNTRFRERSEVDMKKKIARAAAIIEAYKKRFPDEKTRYIITEEDTIEDIDD